MLSNVYENMLLTCAVAKGEMLCVLLLCAAAVAPTFIALSAKIFKLLESVKISVESNLKR